MKYDLRDVQKVIKDHEPELRERFKVGELYVFGSVARGESRDESDIDLFVEFEASARPTLIDLMKLIHFLEELFHKKVDLGTKRSLHPALRDQILREAIRVA